MTFLVTVGQMNQLVFGLLDTREKGGIRVRFTKAGFYFLGVHVTFMTPTGLFKNEDTVNHSRGSPLGPTHPLLAVSALVARAMEPLVPGSLRVRVNKLENPSW